MFKPSWRPQKLRVNLRLVINRLKLLEKKKTENAQKSRKEIADYLASGKYERARIRVEHIIREDYLVEAMELVELYCDLLLARFGLLESMKDCDEGLETAVSSLLYAAPRLAADVSELRIVAESFSIKFGKKFAESACSNANSQVNEHLIQRLSPHGPPAVLVEQYLVEIAKSHKIDFEPDPAVLAGAGISTVDDLMSRLPPVNDTNINDYRGGGGGGGQAMPPQMSQQMPPQMPPQMPQGYPPQQQYPNQQNSMAYPPPVVTNGPSPQHPNGSTPVERFQPPPTYPAGSNSHPTDLPPSYQDPRAPRTVLPNVPLDPVKTANIPDLPSVPNGSIPNAPNSHSNVGQNSAGGDDVDFDDLTRRFEELKKKK